MVKCSETEFYRDDYTYAEEPVDYDKLPITETLIIDSLNEQLPTGEEGKVRAISAFTFPTSTYLGIFSKDSLFR